MASSTSDSPRKQGACCRCSTCQSHRALASHAQTSFQAHCHTSLGSLLYMLNAQQDGESFLMKASRTTKSNDSHGNAQSKFQSCSNIVKLMEGKKCSTFLNERLLKGLADSRLLPEASKHTNGSLLCCSASNRPDCIRRRKPSILGVGPRSMGTKPLLLNRALRWGFALQSCGCGSKVYRSQCLSACIFDLISEVAIFDSTLIPRSLSEGSLVMM